MNSSMALPRHVARPGAAIGWAGFVCGTLDITAAFVVYGFFGARPIPILHGIAAGLLGPRAHQGGMATAALGLACHYFIAFSAAAVYYIASRWLPQLVEHAVVGGILYGVAVYFFMNCVVVPLSAARRSSFSWEMMLIGVAIHICCVGLPIALLVRRFSA
ncbi:MAG TPA: hypothetical protein VMP68_24780 [Candidatus Eisenbacteria bacterium]|nr:hypothetical protein [Candidatus Eisenbacteria bacterium]